MLGSQSAQPSSLLRWINDYSCLTLCYKYEFLFNVVSIAPLFFFPALFIGVLATLHKSFIHSSKSFTSGKIKAKAAREDEGFVWGRCFCWNCDGFCSYCHIPFLHFGPCFLLQALKCNHYDSEPLLRSCGISISTSFTQVDGRVLPAPRVFSFMS